MKILGFLCVSEWSCHGLENPGDGGIAGMMRLKIDRGILWVLMSRLTVSHAWKLVIIHFIYIFMCILIGSRPRDREARNESAVKL